MKRKVFSITRKDLEIQTFRSGGKGGQHQNTCDSGVRIIHPESGAKGECRNFRSQKRNKDEALKRLVKDPRFRVWTNKKLVQLEENIDEKLNLVMSPKNIKIETKINGVWVESN